MGARQKLNGAYVNGCLIFTAVVGVLFESWVVFLITLAIGLALSLQDGSIRPTGRR